MLNFSLFLLVSLLSLCISTYLSLHLLLIFLCYHLYIIANSRSTLKCNSNHYALYWMAAYLGGYDKIDLKYVPAWMQYKIIYRQLFVRYLTDDLPVHSFDYCVPDFYRVSNTNTHNLILSDTFEITDDMLPELQGTVTHVRHSLITDDSFTNNWCRAIYGGVNELNESTELNIIANTNTDNTLCIASNITHKNTYIYKFDENTNKFTTKVKL